MSLPSIFEYLPELGGALLKTAEEPERKQKTPWQVAKTVGSGALGFGIGSLGGMGLAHLADKIHQKAPGAGPIPVGSIQKALPFLGGAAGLAYNLYKAKELEELRDAVQSHLPEGGIPPK